VKLARVRTREGDELIARLDLDAGWAEPIFRTSGPGHDPLIESRSDPEWPLRAPAIGRPLALAEVRLCAPVVAPRKIIAVGLNYVDHANESSIGVPDSPLLFAKLPNAIVGPDDAIACGREDSTQVDYEGELAIVMARRAKRVTADTALDHVLGYTVCNDVSARDAQLREGQWTRAKSFDTFCPLGPWIVTRDEIPDPQALRITTSVNGTVMQDAPTSDMVFSCAELLAYISRVITLEPGDVIVTGTPPGVGFARSPQVWLGDGDLVEIDIDRIGRLRNPVVTGHGAIA
jgi:2-keto-4-pentenoate hydratase/2-oxohepta-3-ene-1,7-dioic acid hydratase in catechol pathway